jgi:uncharacterized membrane protein YeaQ/YmgE (transglycosylase-associated protein family)
VDVEPNPDFFAMLTLWMNDLFVWIGFGTVVGLLAKALMPGRDPGGAIATLGMGIGGTFIGCGLLSFILEGQRVTPISPMGFLVATAGAFIILFFYRLLGGYWFVEGEHPARSRARPHRRRRRRSYAYDYDD